MAGCQKGIIDVLSYAQLSEDVFLHRCFSGKDRGFYIDIGASHPVHCNSTYHFYQRGWSGINVEPTPYRFGELVRARPRDINIMAAVGRKDGKASFNLSLNADHLSSLHQQSADIIGSHRASVHRLNVDLISLATLCEQHAPEEIDFLKIDVEGAEAEVIAGANWSKWRPAVLLIEAVDASDHSPTWVAWEDDLLNADYISVFFDGVNKWYVARERSDLCVHFQTPINPFDGATVFHSFGHPLHDNRHPDHAWSINFAKRLFNAASTETDERLYQVMTWDLLEEERNRSASREGINLAFNRVLNRGPGDADVKHWEGRNDLTLGMLYSELLRGEEFRMKRSRISTGSIHR